MNRRALALVVAPVLAALLAGCTTDTARDTAASTDTGTGTAPGPEAGSGPRATASAPAPQDRSPGRPTPSGTLLVADFGGDTVTFLDPVRGPLASVRVGTAPYGLAVGADGRAWVATAEGVAIVDTRTRESLGRIPYRTDTGPVTTGEYRGGGMGIALSPDGRRVYAGVNVPDGPGVLEVIDTAARKVTATVPVGRRPFDVDVSRDGREVYATNHDSFDVTAVRTDDLRARRHEVAPYGTEGGLGSWLKPHYAVVGADGRLLLPFEGERLAVLDPRTGRVTVERMTADTHQHGVALTPDGTLLAVGTGPIGSADKEPSLTVRAPDGTERVIPLEGPHEDVAVSRDGRTAYVTGGFTRDGHWDGITVVDLDRGTTRRLPGGSRPLGIAVLP
ncbi:YncE family protein [Streptomyces yaizuensis]|uniref:YncE family protein n=1 Tax=Streptomyces yaizuensis TaxID=2989713 RepID=A0ABQ5NZB3_9ACTN|nr:YncE family protein [Streptomyces sp. YSPA8]GLF95696.1 YncE family protein [Streptomyces sp. YSPA8]